MVTKHKIIQANIGIVLMLAILVLGVVSVFAADIDNTPTTQVEVGNANPTVANVVLNGGNAIDLTANATTSFTISYDISDNNGCTNLDTVAGTSSAYRSGVSASCAIEEPATDNLNCYLHFGLSTRTTSTCSGNTINVTDTVQIYYFAESTDATGEFPAQNWAATAFARDLSNGTGSAASAAIELNSLVGIRVTTSSIFYNGGVAMSASSTTGTTNELATTTNVGNVSSTYGVRASATLTSGADSISTSSQRWASSTFDMAIDETGPAGATSTALTETNNTVTGHTELHATTTAGANGRITFWGLKVPDGTPQNTYTGTNVFLGAQAQ